MGRIYLLFWLVLLAVPAIAQDFSQFEKRNYKSSKNLDLPYRILFPENYNRNKKYPLLLFLHGAGERGNDNEKQLIHGGKLFIDEENRKSFQGIVVFPQCPSDNYWANVKIDRNTSPYTFNFDYTKPETNALQAAVELTKKLIAEEAVDKNRVYITGLSMGGMGTFEAVYRNPKLFAAAVPICGGGDAKSYDKRVAKIPFRIFHGDADLVVGVTESQKMVTKLHELKANVIYTEYPGVNHNSWDYAFAEPDFINWFLTKKK